MFNSFILVLLIGVGIIGFWLSYLLLKLVC